VQRAPRFKRTGDLMTFEFQPHLTAPIFEVTSTLNTRVAYVRFDNAVRLPNAIVASEDGR
jgi:hypothetical protein